MIDWRFLNSIILDLTAILLLCEIAVGLYLNSLDGEFVFDDTSVVEVLMPEILQHDRH